MTLKVRVLLMTVVMMFSVFSIADASNNNRVFEGCWTFYPAGPCRAIYRDNKGDYYICGDCDSSGNPGSGSCSRISQQTLAQGYWCS
jgi:hypothetical protein